MLSPKSLPRRRGAVPSFLGAGPRRLCTTFRPYFNLRLNASLAKRTGATRTDATKLDSIVSRVFNGFNVTINATLWPSARGGTHQQVRGLNAHGIRATICGICERAPVAPVHSGSESPAHRFVFFKKELPMTLNCVALHCELDVASWRKATMLEQEKRGEES